MSKNALIAYYNASSRYYEASYVHFGEPDSLGKMLRENYTSKADVAELINLGALSYVAECVLPDPDAPHTFNKPQPFVTVAYARDRGDTYRRSRYLNKQTLVKAMEAAGVGFYFNGRRWTRIR